jgi:4-diphosphocytidyl-2-C-methyl-D-erythritol kinase
MQANIRSYAKINLALNVIKKISNFHKIESIVSFISLHDEILIKRIISKNHIIFFTGKFSKNIGKINTVSNLLSILDNKKLLKNKKFKIKIKKNIPVQAGLGGGSMNAASILNYLIKKKIVRINQKQIVDICKLVGSDVVLGLNSTNTIINYKDEVKRFANDKKIYTLIVKPTIGCSTKRVYSKLRKFNKPKFNKPNKQMFNLNFLKKMTNSLEPIVFSMHRKLKNIKFFLERSTCAEFVRMTGSGSALVAYFYSKEKCDNAKRHFNKKYKNYWCISSKTI